VPGDDRRCMMSRRSPTATVADCILDCCLAYLSCWVQTQALLRCTPAAHALHDRMLGGLKGSVTAKVGSAAKRGLGGGRSAVQAAAAAASSNTSGGAAAANKLLGKVGSSMAAELVPTTRSRSLTSAFNPLMRLVVGGGAGGNAEEEAAEDEGGEGGSLFEGLPRMGSGALLASGGGVRFVGGTAVPSVPSPPGGGGVSKARLADALRSGGSFTGGGGSVSRATSFSSK
jgi:hypothetical protein